jgi:uncharacterized repeat protein (TIGR01451 family)
MNFRTETRIIRTLIPSIQYLVTSVLLLISFSSPGAETTRVSVSNAGIPGNQTSFNISISADGRLVVYASSADNLVAADTNVSSDIFLHDRVTHKTTRLSIDSSGTQGDAGSSGPAISANGRFVAFASTASNLVLSDTNYTYDVFVRDRVLNQTTRVSLSSSGVQGIRRSANPAISADGRFVAFDSIAENLVPGDVNATSDIFVRDRLTNQTSRLSVNDTGEEGNQSSQYPSISADGRYVVFESDASNLVPDDTNDLTDVFIRDRLTNQTRRLSINNSGTQGDSFSYFPSISANGRFVAFHSYAGNLVPGDSNVTGFAFGTGDVFVRDRVTNTTTRVSVSSSGTQGNNHSDFASISADGRFVAFNSIASNLVPNDTNGHLDTFVRDRATNQTSRISLSNIGLQGNHNSTFSKINADGRFVAFESVASNLVAGDTGLTDDIFVRDRLLNPTATADLTVTQSVSANPVPVNSVFSYTATIKNLGPLNAPNVVLTDMMPMNGLVSLLTLSPSQGTCSRAPISICRLGSLNVGQQAKVNIAFIAKKPGSVANLISVNATPKDPTSINTATTNTVISQ